MKKLISALALFLAVIQLGYAQIDTKTKNKIKVKYFAATDSFENKKYEETIEKINEIEVLTKGVKIPTALNLKIKSLVKLNRYEDAKKELNILEGLELDDAIIKDMAVYSGVIETENKKKRDAILKEKENARLALIRKREQLKLDSIQRENDRIAKIAAEKLRKEKEIKNKIAKEKDNANWDLAKSDNTVLAYKKYLNNTNNKLYKAIAKDKIVGIIWIAVIDADDIVKAAKKYLVDNPNGQNKERAEKFIKYASITSLRISYYKSGNIYLKDENGYLSNKNQKDVLKNLGYLVNLKSLHIDRWDHDKPKKIYLYCLRKLENLFISKDLSTNVTFNSIQSLKSLKSLKIDGMESKVDSLYDPFFKLTTLEKVVGTVTDYQIQKLFSNNKNLKEISLGFKGPMTHKNIDLFTSLKKLEKLNFWDLEDFRDYGLPNSIGNLKNLKHLKLVNINKNLPEEIGDLTQLKTLKLYNAGIKTLPRSFGNLKNLEWLDLRYTDIISLPETFALLTNLKELDVYHYSKEKLWKNKSVKKVIKKLKKANSDLIILKKLHDYISTQY
jgi:Leucine-rich repeat (LRR) protein